MTGTRHHTINDTRSFYRMGRRHFGARLRTIRIGLELSLEQVGACTGIAATTLAELEAEARIPDMRILERLCAGLGISLASLLKQ